MRRDGKSRVNRVNGIVVKSCPRRGPPRPRSAGGVSRPRRRGAARRAGQRSACAFLPTAFVFDQRVPAIRSRDPSHSSSCRQVSRALPRREGTRGPRPPPQPLPGASVALEWWRCANLRSPFWKVPLLPATPAARIGTWQPRDRAIAPSTCAAVDHARPPASGCAGQAHDCFHTALAGTNEAKRAHLALLFGDRRGRCWADRSNCARGRGRLRGSWRWRSACRTRSHFDRLCNRVVRGAVDSLIRVAVAVAAAATARAGARVRHRVRRRRAPRRWTLRSRLFRGLALLPRWHSAPPTRCGRQAFRRSCWGLPLLCCTPRLGLHAQVLPHKLLLSHPSSSEQRLESASHVGLRAASLRGGGHRRDTGRGRPGALRREARPGRQAGTRPRRFALDGRVTAPVRRGSRARGTGRRRLRSQR